ncbi:MAG: hypothetical protein V4667_01900 [Bacteroidota bacterium]
MRRLITFLLYILSIEYVIAQSDKSDTTYQISNSEEHLNSFTIKCFIDGWLVRQKTYKNNFVIEEVLKSNDTITYILYSYKNKKISSRELYHIPKDSLSEFKGINEDSYWPRFRFLSETYNEKGMIENKTFYTKIVCFHNDISELEYVPMLTEIYRKGKLKECLIWVQTKGEHSWTGRQIKCKN